MKVQDKITIKADKTAIWKVIAKLSAYADWNPFLTSVEGCFEVNSLLHITISSSNGRQTRKQAVITGLVPERYFSLSITSPFGKWFYELEYIFRFVVNEEAHDEPANTVEVIHEVFCHGLSLRWRKNKFKQFFLRGLGQVNTALKDKTTTSG
ncbi:MAG: hypothetical protein HQK83_02485 [Fibrobacteria bacterium]|nr:hypothetical protein [Fibrobacteria bacterium]